MPSAERLTLDSGRAARNRLPSRKTPRTMSAVSSGTVKSTPELNQLGNNGRA
jgi:hypothetical protein